MQELINDNFYQVLKQYDDLVINYYLFKDDNPYLGEYSHIKATKKAFEILSSKSHEPFNTDINKATYKIIDSKELFIVPDSSWKIKNDDVMAYDSPNKDGKIPYWYAFLEPPFGTSSIIKDDKVIREEYGIEDFDIINKALFPSGIDNLIIYDYNTDFSDYFEIGLEWWGTMCYSIYDKTLDRYVVMMASSTD